MVAAAVTLTGNVMAHSCRFVMELKIVLMFAIGLPLAKQLSIRYKFITLVSVFTIIEGS